GPLLACVATEATYCVGLGMSREKRRVRLAEARTATGMGQGPPRCLYRRAQDPRRGLAIRPPPATSALAALQLAWAPAYPASCANSPKTSLATGSVVSPRNSRYSAAMLATTRSASPQLA